MATKRWVIGIKIRFISRWIWGKRLKLDGSSSAGVVYTTGLSLSFGTIATLKLPVVISQGPKPELIQTHGCFGVLVLRA